MVRGARILFCVFRGSNDGSTGVAAEAVITRVGDPGPRSFPSDRCSLWRGKREGGSTWRKGRVLRGQAPHFNSLCF